MLISLGKLLNLSNGRRVKLNRYLFSDTYNFSLIDASPYSDYSLAFCLFVEFKSITEVV